MCAWQTQWACQATHYFQKGTQSIYAVPRRNQPLWDPLTLACRNGETSLSFCLPFCISFWEIHVHWFSYMMQVHFAQCVPTTPSFVFHFGSHVGPTFYTCLSLFGPPFLESLMLQFLGLCFILPLITGVSFAISVPSKFCFLFLIEFLKFINQLKLNFI